MAEQLFEEAYGPFRGGDPRLFTPDEEVCTPAEIENWRKACAAWEAGEGVDAGPECLTLGNGAVGSATGMGFGINRWPVTSEEFAFMYGDHGHQPQSPEQIVHFGEVD